MTKRIAIVGYFLEANAFAPTTREEHFRALCHVEGEAIVDLMRREASVLPAEIGAFAARMDTLAGWKPVPISAIAATPGGPVEQAFYDSWLADVRARLEAAAPVDAVYIANHGAGAATGDQDSDGTLYAMVRAAVGPRTPVVATLDLHANISQAMVEAADVMIGYRTNPHVDQRERAEEAAEAMAEMFQGMRPHAAFVRLPLCPPSVTLLTAQGPYADLIAYGQARLSPDIVNVSVFGNFTFSDLPKNGVAIVVTARSDARAARACCLDIARKGWAERHRYRRELTPLDEAARLARLAGEGSEDSLILADVGDNPGGGGTGRTTALLRALCEADARDVLYGVFHDPALAREAHELGEGARFRAVFNRDMEGADARFAPRFEAPARVLAVHQGDVVGRRGNRRGRLMPHGPSCLLEIGGVRVAVSSRRLQCYDPAQFEMYGVDLRRARAVVVKSRGHFRAGFDEFCSPERVFEVDSPGLTSPVLSRFAFRHLPRPCFPLDEDAAWAPEA